MIITCTYTCTYIHSHLLQLFHSNNHNCDFMHDGMIILCSNVYVLYIKMSGSESRPRKVELASAHKNATTTESILHITMKLVKTPTKQPFRIYRKVDRFEGFSNRCKIDGMVNDNSSSCNSK